MSGASWAAAALVLMHLTGVGALPKEVPAADVVDYANAQPVRVLIFSGAKSLSVRTGSPTVVENADTEEQVGSVSAGERLSIGRAGGDVVIQGAAVRATGTRLLLRPTEEGKAATLSGTGGWGSRGAYPGTLELRLNGGLSVIEHVDLESYTAGVVAAEVPRNFPLEAMKAQAIAARTYTLFHLGDHESEGADLCSQVHCHAYAGVPSAESRASRAARETAGLVLTYHGLLIDAQYHAACGGETVSAWDTRQGKLLPYLSGETDTSGSDAAYCCYDHGVTWTKRFSYAEAQRLVSRNLRTVLGDPGVSVGRLRSLRVAARAGARVKWLEVKTSTGSYRVMGDAIRWLFGTGLAGPNGLRSTEFDLVTRAGKSGQPQSFVFTGRGHGHGVGMCQWGARGRAAAGQSAEEILTAYYPGTTVENLQSDTLARAEP